jgi:hypothetical protein
MVLNACIPRIARLAIVVVFAFLGSGCGLPQPELRTPVTPPDKTMDTSYGIATKVPETLGAGTFCLSAPGRVTITAVSLHEPQGEIRVDAFAVRPNPVITGDDFIGNTAVPLASIGKGFDLSRPQVIDGVCPTPEELASSTSEYELAIQLTRLSGTLAGALGLEISYMSGSVTKTLVVPNGYWLCSAQQPSGGATQEVGRPPVC